MSYRKRGLVKLYTAETSTEIVKFFTQNSEAKRFSANHKSLSSGHVMIELPLKDEKVFKEVVAELYSTRKISMENYSMRHIMTTMLNNHMDYSMN